MKAGARIVTLIVAGALAAGTTACPNKKAAQPVPVVGPNLGNLSLVKPDVGIRVADPPILQRPLRLPQPAAGAPCPLTAGMNRAGSYVLGSGPVRVTLGEPHDRAGVYHYGDAPMYNGWQLISARWLIEPGANGAIFLHGERLGADKGVWFLPTADSRNMYRTIPVGTLPPIELYRWLLLPAHGGTPRELAVDGGVAVRSPGCFGIQADTPGSSTAIVFEVEP